MEMTDKDRLTVREGGGDQRGGALTIETARPERPADDDATITPWRKVRAPGTRFAARSGHRNGIRQPRWSVSLNRSASMS